MKQHASGLAGLIGIVVFLFMSVRHSQAAGLALIAGLLACALWAGGRNSTRGSTFTIVVLAAVVAAMYYPGQFVAVGSLETQKLIVPLLMLIMFGMGTSTRIEDFKRVLQMPKGVLVGIACQFTIMPLIGAGLASLTRLPPEIAAGIILVGSSPGGLASNVMAYIAGANVALSLTLTAVSTMLAPLLTPLLMQVFANQYVPIDFLAMLWSITRIVIIPIALGLLYSTLARGRSKWLDRLMPLVSMGGIALIIAIITALGRDALLSIGPILILAVIVHNSAGYFLGYWSGRLAGLERSDARTIAFEVGMQNSGLASGIAVEMGKVATMGLAPAVFGPLMNITGSSLATWWKSKNRPASRA